jgi:hypothetical protein
MYAFVKAVALSRSSGAQWTELDLSGQVVYNIFSLYTKIYLELSNPALEDNVYVDMDSLRTEFSGYQGTLNVLLVELGNRTLPTVEQLPSTLVKYVRYSDARMAEYKIDLAIAGMTTPTGYPRSELKDLKLTREKYSTDMELLHKYCLMSVNGFVHWDDATTDAAYIIDGGTSCLHSNCNVAGIVSFLDVGELTKLKIPEESIIPTEVGGTLKNKINFTLDADFTNKSVILILGGYLVLPFDNVFWMSGDKTFTLDLNKLPYIERLFESNQYLDLSPLGLTESSLGERVYDVDELWSDQTIKNYMTLSQSFMVIVDIPQLLSNKIFLRDSNSPGEFTAYQEPRFPLIVNYGKIAEYWKTKEDGYWSVRVQDSYLRNYVVSQQPTKDHQQINDHFLAGKPFYHSTGFLLELAGYSI